MSFNALCKECLASLYCHVPGHVFCTLSDPVVTMLVTPQWLKDWAGLL